MRTSWTRIGIAAALLTAGACKKDEGPQPARPGAAPAAASAAPIPGAAPQAAPIPGAAPQAAPLPAAPAAGPTPSVVPPLPAAGEMSPALARFLDSPEHKKVTELAKSMLAQVEGGKCDRAVDRAGELSELIKKAAGDFKLSLNLKEMAGHIQKDPNYMDRAYMQYKGKLLGLSVGLAFVPMTVKLGGFNPEAKKKACEGFAKQLREIKMP